MECYIASLKLTNDFENPKSLAYPDANMAEMGSPSSRTPHAGR